MDGTNAKSQMMLVNGTFVGFEASATAGDNCTPGISVKYADGKVAVVNALTGSNFSGVGTVVEKFLAGETSVGNNRQRFGAIGQTVKCSFVLFG